MKRFIFAFFIFTTVVCAQPSVLIVGDSWAQLMFKFKLFQDVFEKHGYKDTQILGKKTAIGGTTAAYWAKPDKLAILTAEVNENPSIKYVQIFLGGNDMLSGKLSNGWHTELSPKKADQLFDKISNNMAKIVEHIEKLRPDIKVVIAGYDYLNFEYPMSKNPVGPCTLLWENLGRPKPVQVNNAFYLLERKIQALADKDPRLTYISNYGLLQCHRADNDANITYSSPGDSNEPCPPEFLFKTDKDCDCIHLNTQGYCLIIENLVDQFYSDEFEKCNKK